MSFKLSRYSLIRVDALKTDIQQDWFIWHALLSEFESIQWQKVLFIVLMSDIREYDR